MLSLGNAPAKRGAALLVLGAVLLVLLVGFGSMEPDPADWRFPENEDVSDDYESHVGERVVVYGRVISTDPLRITALHDGERVEFTVTGADVSVQRGEYLEVYGRAKPGMRLEALGTVVFPDGGIWYTYAVSALSVVWVLVRFGRQWRVDPATLAFGRREEDLTWRPWGGD